LYKDILNIISSLPTLNINKTLQLNQDYFVKTKSNNFEIFFEMMQQFFSRLCKTGAMQSPILPSVSNEEEKIMTYLCPSPESAYLWSEAANITLAKLNKGYFLNINIESLIMDAFIYLETCYQTISQNTVTNE
jgi:DNA polymerase-3 subunit delta'